MDDTGLRPKQVEVNKLGSLKFFGESALIDGEEALQNATVTVSSDRCDLLQLKKSSFMKLMESNEHTFKDRHNDSQSVTSGILTFNVTSTSLPSTIIINVSVAPEKSYLANVLPVNVPWV